MSCSGTHRSNCDPLIDSTVIIQLIWGTHRQHVPGILSVMEQINQPDKSFIIIIIIIIIIIFLTVYLRKILVGNQLDTQFLL